MARLARVVVPDYPYHIIQRGNRRQNVFLKPQDKTEYLRILYLQSQFFQLKIWGYCLMDNHVHLVVVPETEESLRLAIGETHKLYTRMINFREKWRGYLWQGRFKSSIMDEKYLYATIRYVERNPVRAGLNQRAEDYCWSSARAHVFKEKNQLLSQCYLEEEIFDWSKYLQENEDEQELKTIRSNSERGRPMGSEQFLKNLEKVTGRNFLKRRPRA